jgi:hypothetical protein
VRQKKQTPINMNYSHEIHNLKIKAMSKKSALLLLAFLLSHLLTLNAQPVVYFDILSHNEETSSWNAPFYYSNNRTYLVNLANYFAANGITWNMQSDWTYLTNVIEQDTAFFPSTSNKNILRWMYEDKGVEMDPHAHESVYLYPDVAKLLDSIGLPESKVIGGSIYNDFNGTNIWTNLINGQYGSIFPDHFWQPEYLMGGGTPNHVDDLKYYGFWNPTSPSDYLTHNPSSPLHNIGVGCEMKIRDTSTVAYFVSLLHDVINNVQNGVYPDTGIYFQTVFFSQGDLTNIAFYNKITEIADSMNVIVASGAAQWKTMKQFYTEWENNGEEVFQWECGDQLVTGIESVKEENTVNIYPNPASDLITIECNASNTELRVTDVAGRLILFSKLTAQVTTIDISNLSSGVYLYQLAEKDRILKGGKLLKE